MTSPDPTALELLQADFAELFIQLSEIERRIRERITEHAVGNRLKGNEHVGWLGEIYGKTLFGGSLVGDRYEHDFETSAGWRVSVKTRKGRGKGWKQTSPIPTYEGEKCPTHLLFVHLDDDYAIDRIWLFCWKELVAARRFKAHKVRGMHRSYVFRLAERRDAPNIVYPRSSISGFSETNHLLKSPCNAERLRAAVQELDAGRGKERKLVE